MRSFMPVQHETKCINVPRNFVYLLGKRGPRKGEGGRPRSIFRVRVGGQEIGFSPRALVNVLDLILSAEEGVNFSRIADCVKLPRPRLSLLLDYLVKSKILKRKVVGRKHVYHVTEEGERFWLQLRAAQFWCPKVFHADFSIREKIKRSLKKSSGADKSYNINRDPDSPSLVMLFVALFFPEVLGFLEQRMSYEEFVKARRRMGGWPLIKDYLVGPRVWRQRIKELVEFMFYAFGSLVAEADAEELRNVLERLKRRKLPSSDYLNNRNGIDFQRGCIWVDGVCYSVLPKKRVMLTLYGFDKLDLISSIYHLYQLPKSEGEYLAYLHDHKIWSSKPPLDKQAYFAQKAAMFKQLNDIKREMDRVEGEHIITREPQENDYSLDPSTSYILENLERLNPKIYGPITPSESGRGMPFNSLAKSNKTENLPLGLSRLQLLAVDKIFRGEFCPTCSNTQEIHLLNRHLLGKKIIGYKCSKCDSTFKAGKAPGEWWNLLWIGKTKAMERREK